MQDLIGYQIPTPLVELLALALMYAWFFIFISGFNNKQQ